MNDFTTLYEGKHVHLVKRNHWEYAHRPNISGIVAIAALTDARELILVEQFRPPVSKPVIELPAGLAGDLDEARGESMADAARRELLEETGFLAGQMKQVAHGPMSAGLSDEIITLFVATSLKRQTAGGGDSSERIVVHLVPLDRIDAWLTARQHAGKLVDVKVFSGLRFLERD